MSNFFYKQKIDAIYLNYEDVLDEDFILNSKYTELINAYPKTRAVLEALEIEKRLFYLTKTSQNKKVIINTENAFLKFSNSLKSNRKDNEKMLSVQLKGAYFLNKTYQDFKEFYLKTEPKSISKIEIAFDFEVVSPNFLKETALLFLDKKNYTNFEGSKTYINLEDDEITGISYLNSSKVIKLYNKKIEIEKNPKKGLYYEKNPEFQNSENFYRIEIGFITSKFIKKFDLDRLIKNEKVNETLIINLLKKEFFKEFKIQKKSELKSIIKQIC